MKAPPHFVVPLADLGFIDGRNWRVKSQVVYYSAVLKNLVLVPVGRVTDFASIPQILWNLYPPVDYAEAAVIHDELYTRQELNGVPITRAQADSVFLEALQLRKLPHGMKLRRFHKTRLFFRYRGFYYALRAAGFKAWNDHTREKEEAQRELARK